MNNNNDFMSLKKLKNTTLCVNKKNIVKKWFLIDANSKILGRLASKISILIRGKNKVYYTPHIDCGDKIIIINASKVLLSGKKIYKKQYVRHTGYPGGQKFYNPCYIINKYPEKLIYNAVKKMLPNNKIRKINMNNLYIYSGDLHPHIGQKPIKIL